jgi:hypothetical protein
MKVRIQPVTIFPDTATYIELTGAQIRSFSSAFITWSLLSEENLSLKSGAVEISGEEYQGWSDDDPYLVDLVVAKLNLTKEA